ncbi:oxidoreductase [Gordonia soli]|uniref:Putative oxidoreductase n=1 Tax=Gordonia soli NBRC 108243 TaxID=1223545 RepID=M0QDX2_9ACTN|nr:oxidoreductase [Gordonia soli]GAC66644.1 putative oxidoreductase [Gordonia soli NBRC 108243]
MSTGSPDISGLLTPLETPSLTLPNRFAMAPMTRMFSPDGVPGADVAEYYRRRAAGGVGLIITEGAFIPDDAVGASRRVPHLWGSDAADGWRGVIDAVHESGSKIVPQLWHMGVGRGAQYKYRPEIETVGPSGIGLDGAPLGRALSTGEVDGLVAAYADAAVFAKEVGFDGLELHGAHGYLLDSFLWSETNRRDDAYGDLLAFPTRVIAAVRAAVGDDFAIIYRFSQWKSERYEARVADTPDELATILTALVDAGVDILHPSTRRFFTPAFPDADEHRTLAGWTRKLSGVPTIAVGSVGLDRVFTDGGVGSVAAGSAGLERVVELFDDEEFDVIAIGRALLSDAEFVTKHAGGRSDEITAYDPAVRGVLA